MNIVFIGPIKKGSTTLHRLVAMRDLGYSVQEINTFYTPSKFDPKFLVDRLKARLYRAGLPTPPGFYDACGVNQSILRTLKNNKCDLLWIDKGLVIDDSTLEHARVLQPNMKIVGYSPDDMYAKHNHSRKFISCLPHYDIFFTTKSYNVSELKALGCPAVVFVDNAFDPHTHRPISLSPDVKNSLGSTIGFIGSYEKERAESMRFLVGKGIPIRVYGGNWERKGYKKDQLFMIEEKTLIADDYAKAICAFDINLHFLRKVNRDKQTTRSIEIPACGGFMLAERTDEHLALFDEGLEAEYFNSNEELKDKSLYYAKNLDQCTRIGQAGHQRCLRSGYSNQDRVKQMFKEVSLLG